MIDLVIIGNGFDLAHVYSTSYKNFIDWYIRKRYKLYFDSGGEITEDELIIINNWIDKKYVEKEIYYSNLNFLAKHDFFGYIINNHLKSDWEGIEREYFKYLYKLVTTSEKAEINTNVKRLNNCLTSIKIELVEYLENNTPKNSFSIDLNGSILDSLDKLFAKCKIEVARSDSRMKISDNRIVLLNFNYTHTASQYFDYYNHKYDINENAFIINIHGNLKDKKSIIFGYGDESDKRYSELEESGDNDILSNFKSFEYLHSKEYSTLIGLLENQKYNIHIMGHSCGVSDRVLLKELFCTDNCQKIQIYYHIKEDGSNDYKDKTMNISRIFPLDQKAAMRKKIVNIRDCKPL